MSIHDWLYKIKGFNSSIDSFTLIYILTIVGVGVSAFGLGRLSSNMDAKSNSNVSIIGAGDYSSTADHTISTNSISAQAYNATNTPNNTIMSNDSYVASKNGKLYYNAGCNGANRINVENQVWFDTASDAEKMGYTLSPSCKQ